MAAMATAGEVISIATSPLLSPRPANPHARARRTRRPRHLPVDDGQAVLVDGDQPCTTCFIGAMVRSYTLFPVQTNPPAGGRLSPSWRSGPWGQAFALGHPSFAGARCWRFSLVCSNLATGPRGPGGCRRSRSTSPPRRCRCCWACPCSRLSFGVMGELLAGPLPRPPLGVRLADDRQISLIRSSPRKAGTQASSARHGSWRHQNAWTPRFRGGEAAGAVASPWPRPRTAGRRPKTQTPAADRVKRAKQGERPQVDGFDAGSGALAGDVRAPLAMGGGAMARSMAENLLPFHRSPRGDPKIGGAAGPGR